MLKLAKYLKKSLGAILAIFVLLVVQAFCDLSLPSYTSDIVNVGIQQGGVQDAAPDVISKTSMDSLFLFMREEDVKTVQQNYVLHENPQELGEIHGAAFQVPVYVPAQNFDREAVEPILGKAMLLSSLFGEGSAETAALQEQMTGALQLPEGMNPSQALAMMDDSARQAMLETIYENLDAAPESLITQSAVVYVKNEYASLGIDTNAMQTQYILLSGAKMLGVTLLSMASTIVTCLLAARVAASFGRDLRGRVFRKVLSFSNTEMDRFSTASLITRSTNDIQQIQLLMVMLLRILLYAPIIGIGGIFKVFRTNSSMAWIIAVAFAAILTIVLVLFGVAMPRFKKMQKLIDKLNLVTREILTGLPVIRAFGTHKHEEERFDDANTALTKTNLFVNRTMALMMPVMMLVMNLISVLIVWNGAHGIDAGTMQVGDMMAFIQYTMQIIMAFLMITMFSIMLPRASVSAHRIHEVLETQPSIHDPQQPAAFDDSKKGVVEFRHVSFRYPDGEENILTDIDFTALPGQTTAIIGSTGSGKSTLVNLIPRFFDVTEGEILVDGRDIRSVSQRELRDRIGYVPQKGVLFSGTIETNLKYGDKDISDADMERAADIAQATGFISEKEDGYQSEISQGGTNVSGGQRQRLSIARAIAGNPEIYIFDDSFSALDYQTDRALRAALKEKTGGSTVIIVAQRISTISHADQIIVLDEGKVAGIGTHQELLKTCEVYRQIGLSQMSEEELGA